MLPLKSAMMSVMRSSTVTLVAISSLALRVAIWRRRLVVVRMRLAITAIMSSAASGRRRMKSTSVARSRIEQLGILHHRGVGVAAAMVQQRQLAEQVAARGGGQHQLLAQLVGGRQLDLAGAHDIHAVARLALLEDAVGRPGKRTCSIICARAARSSASSSWNNGTSASNETTGDIADRSHSLSKDFAPTIAAGGGGRQRLINHIYQCTVCCAANADYAILRSGGVSTSGQRRRRPLEESET